MRGFRTIAFGIAVATAMACGSASAADLSTLLPDLSTITFDRDASARVRLASNFSNSAAVITADPVYGPPRARVITAKDTSLSMPLGSTVMLDLVYNANMGARAGIYDARASQGSDGLFFSGGALNSPYAAVVNGATYAGVTVKLSDDVNLRLGGASLSPGRVTHLNDPVSTLLALDGNMPGYESRRGDAMMAGLNWDFASWGGLGLVAMQTNERMVPGLGLNNFENSSATTQSLGLSARFGLGDGWVTTASFSAGTSQIDSRYALQFGETTQRSKAYGLAIAKHGLFGTDSSLGLSVSRPLQNSWTLGSNQQRQVFFGRANLLENNIQETDIEVGYVTSFMDGALALQTNAAYQVNGGQNGRDAVSLLSRAKIKF